MQIGHVSCPIASGTTSRSSPPAAAFRGRDVEKTYWALVVGQPDAREGRIDLALAKLGGPRGERSDTRDVKRTLAVVPFRHSKLTEILMDYFVGDGRAVSSSVGRGERGGLMAGHR